MSGPLVEIPYFQTSCDQVIEPYLRLFGFCSAVMQREGEEDTHHAIYTNDEMRMDFSYWPEDFPNYCVMIGIGFIAGEVLTSSDTIGLWYTIPEDKQELWAFSNQQELLKVLTHIRDEILPAYAQPLWKDAQSLRQVITRFHNEHESKLEAEETKSRKRQAETAFKSGDYDAAVEIYMELSPVDLTSTDFKRLAIARKRLKKLNN